MLFPIGLAAATYPASASSSEDKPIQQRYAEPRVWYLRGGDGSTVEQSRALSGSPPKISYAVNKEDIQMPKPLSPQCSLGLDLHS